MCPFDWELGEWHHDKGPNTFYGSLISVLGLFWMWHFDFQSARSSLPAGFLQQ
jgi:hypothetical protein